MERILDLIMVAGLWGSIALLIIWGGILCVRDTFAAERRNAAAPKPKLGRKAGQDRPHSWLALGD